MMVAFVDDLALIEVLIGLVAALVAYAGVPVWWAMRQNDALAVRRALGSLEVPAAVLGAVTLAVPVDGEFVWPLSAVVPVNGVPTNVLAGCNIFSFDPMLLLGTLLVANAAAVSFRVRFQYVGLFARIVGGVVALYVYSGYTASPAFTTDPFDTLLLYSGIATVALGAFPASILVDSYLKMAEKGALAFRTSHSVPTGAATRFGQLGATSATPGAVASPATMESDVYYFPL